MFAMSLFTIGLRIATLHLQIHYIVFKKDTLGILDSIGQQVGKDIEKVTFLNQFM